MSAFDNPKTKAQLIEHCKARLANPVTRINVSKEQYEVCVKEALALFVQYHYEATHKVYIAQQITNDDKTRGYFLTPPDVVQVTRVISSEGVFGNSTGNLLIPGNGWSSLAFGNPLFSLGGGQMSSFDTYVSPLMQYYSVRSYMADVQNILHAEDEFTWSSTTRRLQTIGRQTKHVVGQYLVYEAFSTLENYQEVVDTEGSNFWSNDWLIRYTEALFAQQWGKNLSKFTSIPLPGGAQVDAAGILARAKEDITALREELRESYTAWPAIFVG